MIAPRSAGAPLRLLALLTTGAAAACERGGTGARLLGGRPGMSLTEGSGCGGGGALDPPKAFAMLLQTPHELHSVAMMTAAVARMKMARATRWTLSYLSPEQGGAATPNDELFWT